MITHNDFTLGMLVVLLMLSIHFVADFILQNDWMAINKSSSWMALTVHVLIYSVPFSIAFGVTFGLLTFALHFVQDALTSRLTAYLWQKNQRHWFFVAIGFDQLLHTFALVWAFYLTQ